MPSGLVLEGFFLPAVALAASLGRFIEYLGSFKAVVGEMKTKKLPALDEPQAAHYEITGGLKACYGPGSSARYF
jgi:hypothetical protein